MNLPRARGRASVGTGAGALAREGFGVIAGATGASVVVGLAGGAIDTPAPTPRLDDFARGSHSRTTRSSAAVPPRGAPSESIRGRPGPSGCPAADAQGRPEAGAGARGRAWSR